MGYNIVVINKLKRSELFLDLVLTCIILRVIISVIRSEIKIWR